MARFASPAGADDDRERFPTIRPHDEQIEQQPRRPKMGRGEDTFWTLLHETAFTPKQSPKEPIFYASPSSSDPRVWSINLATLQRVRIHALRYKISQGVKIMRDSRNDREILESYTDGAQDFLLKRYCALFISISDPSK